MTASHSMIAGQTSKSTINSADHKVSPHSTNTAAAKAIASQGHNQAHLFMATPFCYSFTRFSLTAFSITDTELKLIAAAAMIGESNKPKNGYSTPAATGMPSTL